MTIKVGTWAIEDTTVVLTEKLLFKTFMMTGTKIGDTTMEEISYLHVNSLVYRFDTLKKVSKISQELNDILDRIGKP